MRGNLTLCGVQSEKTNFWGKRIFRFASADFRPQKGVWGMNAGGIEFMHFLLAEKRYAILLAKKYKNR